MNPLQSSLKRLFFFSAMSFPTWPRSRRDFLLGTVAGLLVHPLYCRINKHVGGGGNNGPAGMATAATRAHLAARNPAESAIYLEEAGREGVFEWNTTDLSAQVKVDTQQGIYISPAWEFSGTAGAWVRQFDGPMHVRWFGAAIDGCKDDTDAYQGLASLHALIGGEIDFGVGTAIVQRQIRLACPTTVHGDITLDASAAKVEARNFLVSEDGSQSGLIFDGGDLIALPMLAIDAAPGAQKLKFASAHGLSSGDTMTLWNSTTASFSNWRANYHDGEHARVAQALSPTEILLDRQLRANLPIASTQCFRRPMKGIKLVGNLRYRAPDTLHTACRLRHLDDSCIDCLNVSGGASAALTLQKCFGVTGHRIQATQHGAMGGTDYGLLIGNSQAINFTSGAFRGRRHAVTLGGDAAPGAVPCRDVEVHGEYANDPSSGVTALTVHGNAEDYVLRGVSHGGVSLGGDRGAFYGHAYSPTQSNLYTIHFAELLGTTFSLDGSRVNSSGNPNAGGKARGVINLGGGEQSISANTVRGGIISLRDVELYSPNADRPIVMRNRGCTTSTVIAVDMTGLKVLASAAEPVLVFRPVAGKPWDVIWIADMQLPPNTRWSGRATAMKATRRSG